MIVCPKCGGEAEASLGCQACDGTGHLTWDQYARVVNQDNPVPHRHVGPTEHHQACVAFMEVVGHHMTKWPQLRWLHHIGNERKDVKEARQCKSEGTLPGVPDYCLPWPSAGLHGLYLEMKRPGDSLRPAQREFLEAVATAGYRAVVAYGSAQAWQAVEGYLSGTVCEAGKVAAYR